MLSPLVSAGVFVSDLESATRFFVEVLELEPIRTVEHEDPDAATFLGCTPGAKVRYRLFRGSPDFIGMLSLFEITMPTPAGITRSGDCAHLGECCLVFRCADVDRIYARMLERAHPVLCPPRDLHNPDGSRNREMTFRAPGSVLINLMQKYAT
jgi:catechol 2,3-dioxygenase-like lactoylglutathione lyase family enzyme